ncbi:hypothetical protein U9M48_044257 [Paspalum notatum var. saurae]|uniref:Uncharacterized protein n=1 Tax=Paspalum notatum var. saurae TaxID=547442 RepID=A0AAQ3UUW4_PASNO
MKDAEFVFNTAAKDTFEAMKVAAESKKLVGAKIDRIAKRVGEEAPSPRSSCLLRLQVRKEQQTAPVVGSSLRVSSDTFFK